MQAMRCTSKALRRSSTALPSLPISSACQPSQAPPTVRIQDPPFLPFFFSLHLFVPSLSWQIIVFVFRALKNNSWKTVRPLLLLQVSTSRRAGCGRITSAALPPSGAENGIFFRGFPMFVPSLSWQNDRFYIQMAPKCRFLRRLVIRRRNPEGAASTERV